MKVRNLTLVVYVVILSLLLLPVNHQTSAQATDCGEVYVVQPGDTLREIAARCGLSVEALMDLNPFIEDRNVINAGWILDLTPSTTQVPIPETGAGPRSDALYVVKAGDTLSYIARRLDISENDLLAANPSLESDQDLRTGQILRLSNNISSPAAAVSPQVVDPGQLVTLVAGGFPANAGLQIAGWPLGEQGVVLKRDQTGSDGWLRTTVQIPAQADRGNRWAMVVQLVNNSNVQAHTNLLYVVDTSGPEEPIVYTVGVNDTLSSIAARFGVSIEAIANINPQIENTRLIRVGQEILIPGELMRQQPQEGQAGIFLGSTRVAPGSEIDVFGTGFPADANIGLQLVSGDNQAESLASTTIQTNPRGTFYTSLTIPSNVRANESLLITADPGDDANIAAPTAQLTVTGPGIPQTGDPVIPPSIRLDRNSGPPGTIFTVTISGYPANLPIEMGIGRSQSTPHVIYSYRTDEDGSFFVRIQIPQTARPGDFYSINFSPSQGNSNAPRLSARFDVTQ